MSRAYLYRVARNLGINHAVREGKLRFLPIDETDADKLAASQGDPETILAGKEQLRLVEAVLAAMPERQRRAFILHRIESQPIALIAKQLGLSTSRTWELIRDAYREIVLKTGGL